MTMTTPAPSRLLSIPRELRDIIYALALTDFPVKVGADSSTAHLPSLLLANRQIHNETIDVYYKLLIVTVSPYHSGQFLRWLGKLPTSRCELISEIRIDSPKEGYDTGQLLKLKDRVRKHYLLAKAKDVLAKNGTPIDRGVLKMHVCTGHREEDWVWTSEPLGLKWRVGRMVKESHDLVGT